MLICTLRCKLSCLSFILASNFWTIFFQVNFRHEGGILAQKGIRGQLKFIKRAIQNCHQNFILVTGSLLKSPVQTMRYKIWPRGSILDRKREETFFRLLLCLYNMRRVARVQDHVQWFPHTEEKETIYTHCSFHTPILFSRGLPVCDLVRALPVSCCTKTTTTEKKPSRINGRRWIPCVGYSEAAIAGRL